jgi:glucokinase
MTDASQKPYWLGFDLGGTKMLASLFDSQFRPVARERKRTKDHGGIEQGLARILKTVRECITKSEVPVERIGAIGVGFPGPVDMSTGRLLEAVNLGWQDMPLRETLEREFGCPVRIANDVDVGVYGEYRFGAAQGYRSVLGVFPGTGIGGGFIYEGKIFHGTHSSCMEFGHIQINPRGRICGCGLSGCLETEASRLAISADAAKAAYRGEAPALRESAGADLFEIRSGALAEAIREGDVIIEQIVLRAAEKIGVAVANAVSLLCPDVIVLGGGLVEAMPDLFVNTVWETAKLHVMSPFRELFKVVAAKLGDDAAAMGAAAWVADNASDV